MFEHSRGVRSAGRVKAVLVSLDFGLRNATESLGELRQLASSAGVDCSAVVGGRRERPDPKHFAGAGKVEEIRARAAESHADLVIFNHELSPAQQRNLETTLGCRVLDRVSLILDIFGQRARSHEGKLQVELAQLEYLATRLVRGWTHLERQRGARGTMGGMGEKQIEVDRRLIGKRVKALKDQLVRLKRQRLVQRRARVRGQVMSVSLVGYTNTGKSTLFNALTRAGAYAADQLFATLDTTTRRVHLPEAGALVISDTVGFIRDLPHTLVAAFRATLEETIHADLLLHVVDASSPSRDAQTGEVNRVLGEIGAADIPQIFVWNKIDLNDMAPGLERDEYGKICRVRLSAATGEGVEFLRLALTEVATARNAVNHPEPQQII
ncbi:MAG: GTPase HflX [Betaproteobacteria bacterium RIFCSPLOWO2_12_FULL_63_13]|nr:MAG: GTPase HflX [Betaproteobacteria bacterium RIFCSPLOWO2_12_FULL_63_13]